MTRERTRAMALAAVAAEVALTLPVAASAAFGLPRGLGAWVLVWVVAWVLLPTTLALMTWKRLRHLPRDVSPIGRAIARGLMEFNALKLVAMVLGYSHLVVALHLASTAPEPSQQVQDTPSAAGPDP